MPILMKRVDIGFFYFTMLSIIYILMALAFVSVISKLSLNKWWLSVIYAIIYIVFCLYVGDYAINSSKNNIEAIFSDKITRETFAILLTIELIVLIAYAFRSDIKSLDESRASKLSIYKNKLAIVAKLIEKYYISLLIFPSIFIVLIESIYRMPGVDFSLLTWSVALSIGAWTILMPIIIKCALPTKKMREEFLLFSTILMCIVALFATSDATIMYKNTSESHIDIITIIYSLIAIALLVVIGFIIGRNKKISIR